MDVSDSGALRRKHTLGSRQAQRKQSSRGVSCPVTGQQGQKGEELGIVSMCHLREGDGKQTQNPLNPL